MDQPTYAALLRRQNWSDLHARLTTYALRRTRARDVRDVEDIVQEAIAHAWDPEYQRWDPSREPELLRFLMSHVNSIVANGYGTQKRRKPVRDPEKALAFKPALAPTPERALELADLADRAATMLRERLAASADALGDQLLTLFEEEIAAPAEQAQATARPIDDIRFARRRVFRHADAVRTELGIALHEVQ
jgi:DNA-directed RNA polymerase specialized sigma24 family protein